MVSRKSFASIASRWVAAAFLINAACGGDESDSEEPANVGSSAIVQCRTVELEADLIADTDPYQSVDDTYPASPPLALPFPASLAASNPHGAASVRLEFTRTTAPTSPLWCEYLCAGSSCSTGYVRGKCFEGWTRLTGFDADAPVENVSAITLKVRGSHYYATEDVVPNEHGTIRATFAHVEVEPCHSPCLDLDDEQDCTIDQCVIENGVPTVVRTNMCGEHPLAPGLAATVGSVLLGLTTGSDPVQRPTDPNGTVEVDPVRAAGLTGSVVRHDGLPAAGARVEVANHPEFGWTEVDANGEFILMVEGDQMLTVSYSSAGYLPVHRPVTADAQGWGRADDVVLTPRASTITEIDLAAQTDMAVAHGSTEEDARGARRGALFVPPGTVAHLVMPDGTVDPDPLNTISLGIAEYTVGEDGPARMPAPLPATSAYTYAVELSADEARTAGAEGVIFEEPGVVYYVENFLGFNVGTIVPSGRYDRSQRAWIPNENGLVIKVLSESGGAATIDVDGDGLADTGTELTNLGITSDELETLADEYAPGAELWRAPITHFSPCDLNYPPLWSCSDDCGDPPPPDGGGPEPDPCEKNGSIIECESQVLGERIPLSGTEGLTLNYRSDRTFGFAASRTVKVPITGDTVHPELKRVEAELLVAGQSIRTVVDCAIDGCVPNAWVELTWDGRDRFGRPIQGRTQATVRTSLYFPVIYGPPSTIWSEAFAQVTSTNGTLGTSLIGELPRRRSHTMFLGGWDARSFGLGGWSLSAVHAYDPVARTVYYGDGRRRHVDEETPRIRKFSGRNGRALPHPDGVALTNGTSIYVVNPDAVAAGQLADGTAAEYTIPLPSDGVTGPCQGITVAPDGTIFAARGSKIFRREPDGTWTHVAGNGGATDTGNNGPATEAGIEEFNLMAAGADGSLYIQTDKWIRKVTPPKSAAEPGLIQNIIGDGANRSDGMFASSASHWWDTTNMVVEDDGSVLYVLNTLGTGSIWRIEPDGRLRTVVASGGDCETSPSCAAGDMRLREPRGVARGRDGTLFFVNQVHGWGAASRSRSVVAEEGDRANVIAGRRDVSCTSGTYCGDLGPAAAAQLGEVKVAVLTRDRLALSYPYGGGQLVVEPQLPGLGLTEVYIPSEDARVVDVFSPGGQHLRTLDGRTGLAVLTVAYDNAGRVESLTDQFGRQTTISPTIVDGEVESASITGPFGRETALAMDDGWLAGVANDEAEAFAIVHDGSGLLTSFKAPDHAEPSTFGYDQLGRLRFDIGPLDAVEPGQHTIELVRTELTDGYRVDHVSAVGYVQSHEVRDVAGQRVRKVTRPDGLYAQSSRRADGVVTTVMPDGTQIERTFLPDPRWGNAARYVAREVTTVPNETSPAPGPGPKYRFRQRTVSFPSGVTDPFQFTWVRERSWTNPAMTNAWPSGWPNPSAQAAESLYTRSTRTEVINSEAQRVRTIVYDTLGRVASDTAPGEAATTLSPHAVTARVGTITQGTRSATHDYDAYGRLEEYTDAESNITTYGYDSADRVTSVNHPDTGVTGLGYDDGGQLSSVTPPDQTAHALAEDDRDLLATYGPPSLGTGTWTTTHQYDSDKRVIEESRPGVTLVYDYAPPGSTPAAAVGKLRSVEVASSPWAVTRGYDTSGRLDTMSGPYWNGSTAAQQLAFAYHGPLVRSEEFLGAVGGAGVGVVWGYNQRHLVESETVDGGSAVAFTYDADGLVTTAGELNIGRVPATGNIHCVWNATGGSSIREWREYDTTYGELSSIEYRRYATFGTPADNCATVACAPLDSSAPCASNATPGDQLLRLDFVRDDLGRIWTKTETVGGTSVQYEYSYDEAGRLIDVLKGGSPFEHYEYDKNGNRLVATYGTAAAINATYDDQDRLLTHNVWTNIDYTPNGELVERLDTNGNGLELEYDPFGSLISATVNGSATANAYDTDARGRRLQTRYGGSTVGRWIWRSPLQPVAELNSSDQVVARYVYSDGVNVPDLVMAGTERWRLIKDHLGSVRMVVDVATGTLLRSLEFDAFGRVIAESGDLDIVPFGFAGGMWDSDTRLVRFGARDYDPETGRWTAKDPIRFRGGDTNIYAYVGNDPVNGIDPKGLDTCSAYWGTSGVGTCMLCALVVPDNPAAQLAICGGICGMAFVLSGEAICAPPDPPDPSDDGGICPDDCDPEDATCY